MVWVDCVMAEDRLSSAFIGAIRSVAGGHRGFRGRRFGRRIFPCRLFRRLCAAQRLRGWLRLLGGHGRDRQQGQQQRQEMTAHSELQDASGA